MRAALWLEMYSRQSQLSTYKTKSLTYWDSGNICCFFLTCIFCTLGFFSDGITCRVTDITLTNLLANSISSAISQFELKDLNIRVLAIRVLYMYA